MEFKPITINIPRATPHQREFIEHKLILLRFSPKGKLKFLVDYSNMEDRKQRIKGIGDLYKSEASGIITELMVECRPWSEYEEYRK